MATAWTPITYFEQAKHGATPATVPGGVFATFSVVENVVEAQMGEDPGVSKQDKTFGRIELAVSTDDEVAYATLLTNAESNLVLHYKTAGETARKMTVKNVLFRALDTAQFPTRGATAPARFGLRGVATWGDTDTISTMIVQAADA